MNELKKEINDLGFFGGAFGDAETRKRRFELLQKKNDRFSEIDSWGTSLDAAATTAEAGNIDFDLMGIEKGEMFTAIISSNTKNKVTPYGHVAKMSRDTKTDELIYKLYQEDGVTETINEYTGEPVTMSLKEFKSAVANNLKDVDGVYQKAWNDAYLAVEKRGNTNGGPYNEYEQGIVNNATKTLTDTPDKLRRAMRTTFGHADVSFYDELVNPERDENGNIIGSEISVDVFNSLGKILPRNEKGEMNQEGVLANVQDLDGSGGISNEEMQSPANYMALSGAILGMADENATRRIFNDWANKKMGEGYGHGDSLRTPVGSGAGGGKGGAHFFKGVGQISDATFQRDYAPYVNFLNNPKEGQEMLSPIEKLKVKYQGGQFNIFNNEQEEYVPVGNAKDAAEYDQLSNYVKGPAKITSGSSAKNYNDIIDINFIKMTEENAETYLKENLPEGFTFNQYGIGDAIKVMYGDKSIKINLQPNTTSGENKNIKKLQDFIKEVLGTGKYD